MDIPIRTGFAPSSPRSSDSPMSTPAPHQAAGVTVPVASMQMPPASTAQPDAWQAQAIHDRVGPCVPASRPDRVLDGGRIGRNAMVSALAQGSCFGLAFSLNNYLRATARPFIKQLAGFLSPILAGGLTSPAETAVRRMTGMNPTALPEGTSGVWHDAIPSVVLFAINKAYAKSCRLPKFAPGTPAGMATTVLLSVVGTGVAGALSEASAQVAGGRREQSPLDTRATIERGMARATTLVPMGAANLYAARHLVNKGQLPPNLGLKPLGVGVVGWAGRNKLGGWISQRLGRTSTPQSTSTPQPNPQPGSQPVPQPLAAQTQAAPLQPVTAAMPPPPGGLHPPSVGLPASQGQAALPPSPPPRSDLSSPTWPG